MNWEKIQVNSVNSFLHRQRNGNVEMNWTKATQTIEGYEKTGTFKFRVRLGYFMDYDEVSGIVQRAPIFNIVIILIKAGIATVGFFENGEISSHKVFRAYMIRKKQGKSQIKYLKTKGKSRAGSRVRLRETLEFFADINTRVNELLEKNHIDRVAISCSKTLWPYFFGSEVKPAIEMRDDRLIRVPIHIPNATHLYLLKTHAHLSTCRLLAPKDVLEEIIDLEKRQQNKDPEHDTENW